MQNVLVLQNFIGGQFLPTSGYIDGYDPATGRVAFRVPDSSESEVGEAVKAAKAAFPGWAATSVSERTRLLNRIADLIELRLDEFARAESQDQGKPLWLSRSVDVPRAITNFRHFATTALCVNNIAQAEQEIGVLNYTVRVPLGVAGVISPWNLPIYLLTFKIAPALAFGNTVVAKPSEFTSLTAWMLCSVFHEAGIPPGVVNVVFGYGPKAGESLVRHPDVPLISFTGSTRIGTHITEITAHQAKKLSLEMGGKNAAVVFDDADLEKCVPTLIRASFVNSGQICLSTSRVYVQRPIFKDFVKRFVDQTSKIVVGPPEAEGTWMGPLVSQNHLQKVKAYLALAKQEGAVFLFGEDHQTRKNHLPPDNMAGFFVGPTVLTNLPDNARCMQEEIFGPVTCIMPFDTEEEVVDRTNDVEYGLCASLWSTNVNRIHRVAPLLQVGTIWCNCWLLRNLHMPFGGMKMSGLGREGTEDSRDFFTEKKTICVKLD